MSETHKKRTYNSERRRAQAAETRARMLSAAQTLFERDGYVATTIDGIAREAGVALQTVYSAFSTKSGVLRGVWDLLLKGDLDDAPVADRSWFREVFEETDPERQLRLHARNVRMVRDRVGRFLRVIRDAAAVDPDAAELWNLIETEYYENQRNIVRSVKANGGLRPDLDVRHATDILWTLNHPDVWLLLVERRGWSRDRFENWFADAACQQLLG